MGRLISWLAVGSGNLKKFRNLKTDVKFNPSTERKKLIKILSWYSCAIDA